MVAEKQRNHRVWSLRKRWAAILLLWLLFVQTLGAARAASITFDEGPHLAVGYATLRTGDLRLQPIHIHPPLANILAAAPLLLAPDCAVLWCEVDTPYSYVPLPHRLTQHS